MSQVLLQLWGLLHTRWTNKREVALGAKTKEVDPPRLAAVNVREPVSWGCATLLLGSDELQLPADYLVLK